MKSVAGDAETTGSARAAWGAAIAVIAGQLLCLLVLAKSLPGSLGNTDAGAKVWQVESLLRGSEGVVYTGAEYDPEGLFVPRWYTVRVAGKPYSVYHGLFTCAMAAVVRWTGRWGYQLLPLACGAATVLLCAALTLRHRLAVPGRAWVGLLAVGLATPVLVYSLLPMEHIAAAAFATAALLAAAEAIRRRGASPAKTPWGLLAGMGALLAVAALLRGECYVLLVAAGGVTLWFLRGMGWKRTAISGVAMFSAAAVVLLAWWTVNPVAFQVHLELAAIVRRLPMGLGLRAWNTLLRVDAGNAVASRIGPAASWCVAAGAAGCLLLAATLGFFAGLRRSWWRHLAAASFVAGLALILVAANVEGLFAALPIVVLAAFVARGRSETDSPVSRAVAWTFVVWAALLLLSSPNVGTPQSMPRYLLPGIPALVVVVAGRLTRTTRATRSRFLTVMLVLALGSGLSTALKGVLQCARAASLSRQVEAALMDVPEPIVNCDMHALHVYHAPRVLLERVVLEAASPEQFEEIVARLRARGVRSFSVIWESALWAPPLATEKSGTFSVRERREIPYSGNVTVVSLEGESRKP